MAGEDAGLHGVTARIQESMRAHRPLVDRLERMSRGVQGINLNVGQDFDEVLQELTQVVGTEIEWELSVGLPEIKGSLTRSDREEEPKSAGHLLRHAPTNLDPAGPRWWERVPLISRLITLYDHLRDFPWRAVRNR